MTSSLQKPEPRSWRIANIACWFVILALGAWRAWASRFFMNPDGVSYLDIGDAFWRGHWPAAFNCYWSPVYPLLLGLVLKLAHPSIAWQFMVVHGTNLLIYVVSAASLSFLLSEIRRARAAAGPQPDFLAWSITVAGYVLFLHTSLIMISIHQVTPDLLLSAFIYLAAALQLRLRRAENPTRISLLLGVTLGIGYLAKTIMLPLALPCLAAAALPFRDLRRRLLPAAVAFAALALPFITAISLRYHRPTFGESSRYNIAAFVNQSFDTVDRWAKPLPPGAGEWKNPPRTIWSYPVAFSYELDSAGTYPPWYDPALWMDGLKAPFQPRALLAAIRRNIPRMASLFLAGPPLTILIASMVVFLLNPAGWIKRAARYHGLWLLSLTGAAAYAMTLVEPRYVGAFVVLTGLALLAPAAPRHTRPVAAAILLAALASLTWFTRDLLRVPNTPNATQIEVAKLLLRHDLHPGDPVACIGRGYRAYWARLAGLRVIAEVPLRSATEFWDCEEASRRGALVALASTGAKIAVAKDLPDAAGREGWQRLGETAYWVRELDRFNSGEAPPDNPALNIQNSPWRRP